VSFSDRPGQDSGSEQLESSAPIHARIKTEKGRRLWDVLPALIALGTALITSGLCALLAPELAGYAFAGALALSMASYMGQILFTWLTEELGEG
jgi:hypothetical protein